MKIRFDKYQIMLILFLISFILRLGYIYEMRAHPAFIRLGRGLDSYHFHKEAERISGGDFLQKDRSFHQAPGYSYFVGLVYKLIKPHYQAVRIMQAFLSSLSVLLIFLIAGFYSQKSSASFLSALLWTFYGPAVFYDGLFLKTSLIIFLFLSFTLCLHLFVIKNKAGLLCGIFLGLLIIVRPNFLILLPFCWMAKVFTSKQKKPYQGLLFFFLGILLFPGLLFARNIFFHIPFYKISSVGPRAVIQGQYPDNKRIGWDDSPQGDKLLENGHKIFPSLLHEITKHPGLWLNLQVSKLQALFSWYEYPNNYNFYIFKESSRFLSLGMISFIPVFIMALAVVISQWKSFRHKKLFFLLFFGLFLCVFPFYPFSRFRMPIVALLTIPSGMFFLPLSKSVKHKDMASLLAAVFLLVISFIYPCALSHRFSLIRTIDYFNFGNYFLECRHFEDSERYYKLALQKDPDYLPAMNHLGLLYYGHGHYDRAEAMWIESLQKDPRQETLNLWLNRITIKRKKNQE